MMTSNLNIGWALNVNVTGFFLSDFEDHYVRYLRLYLLRENHINYILKN